MITINVCNCGDAVKHARDILPGQDSIDEVAETFKLFGDPTRVGILCALCHHELCVCEIASVLSMTSSAISHQLRLMKQMGIIRSRRSGKSVIYSIADEHIEEIFSLALAHAEERLR